MQKGIFRDVKDALLPFNMCSFAIRFGTYRKTVDGHAFVH